ncbi:DnaB-like helicase C-terminal domain-containing protein [Leisingera sp. ANG-M1]|uniref:DnaB-like helicase C-terminal domain-containing protein n=1 Tax=Leisingera sp. ANG-M1 TaxID=1577895 RepID=UPI000691D51C|nr:DnaB-like helicase C-terminal domain-containing protein [Leisingera sp. ANG-M1]
MTKVSEFSPNLPLLRAVRRSNSAILSDLCAIAGLDPSNDFKTLEFSDLDFRGSELGDFIVSLDTPEFATAQQVTELVNQLSQAAEPPNSQSTSSSPVGSYSEEVEETSEASFKPFLHSLASAVSAVDMAYQQGASVIGLSSGLLDLDKHLGGFQKPDLVVLAAAPSMGKTALLTQIALNIASTSSNPSAETNYERGGKVGYFSLQLSAEQIAQRILAIESDVPFDRVQRGDMTEAEFRRYVQAAKTLEAIPLFIDDTFGDVEVVATRAQKLKKDVGLDVLMIDMVDDITVNQSSNSSYPAKLESVLRDLKQLARDLNICVLVTADIGDAVPKRGKKRPNLTDQGRIGAINRAADVVLFLYREEFYLEQQRPDDFDLAAVEQWKSHMERAHGRAEITVAKQRNGPIGFVELSFEQRLTKFSNMAKPWDTY